MGLCNGVEASTNTPPTARQCLWGGWGWCCYKELRHILIMKAPLTIDYGDEVDDGGLCNKVEASSNTPPSASQCLWWNGGWNCSKEVSYMNTIKTPVDYWMAEGGAPLKWSSLRNHHPNVTDARLSTWESCVTRLISDFITWEDWRLQLLLYDSQRNAPKNCSQELSKCPLTPDEACKRRELVPSRNEAAWNRREKKEKLYHATNICKGFTTRQGRGWIWCKDTSLNWTNLTSWIWQNPNINKEHEERYGCAL